MWHVGMLYRVGDMLELLDQEPATRAALLKDFRAYRGVHTGRLIDLAFTGRWVQYDNQNNMVLTRHGRDLVALRDPVLRLRSQVIALIDILSPPWAASTIQGRKAFAQYSPGEAVQCFREAGILDSLDEGVISWWDRVAGRYREDRDAQKVETGRKGERLSYYYEHNRTGKEPHWIALEYEGAGYDIVSQLTSDDPTPLIIQVKASTETWEHARFHLTRHEWEVLKVEHAAVCHLWSSIECRPVLFVVTIETLAPHLPIDREDGRWEVAVCPFKVFLECGQP